MLVQKEAVNGMGKLKNEVAASKPVVNQKNAKAGYQPLRNEGQAGVG